MPEKIPYARPFIGKEEEEGVLRVLRSGWLTTGPETLAFEEEFAAFLQKNNQKNASPLYCMAVNSATSGLHLALEACGIKAGDLVLVPTMTFTATAEVVRYLGAEAVFVDSLPGGFNMDPQALERTLEELEKESPGKAQAVMPVHYGGLPCDMEAINGIAQRFKIQVIEDAAHSFPSFLPSDKGAPGSSGLFAGDMSKLGVFSFYATKTITTGEGGMVVTRDKEMAERIRIMRSHGIDRSVFHRYTDTRASWFYQVVEPGFKYNIPDLLSALGRAQLNRAWDLLSAREDLVRRYDEAFSEGPFILPPTGPGDARHLYPLRFKTEELKADRALLAQEIQEEGVGISVHFIPLHTMPYYKTRYSLNDHDFPHALDSFNRAISLPLWPGMTVSQIERVITVVKETASRYTS
ncbi:MAG: DegT/DnrJ/EryC1/StrS family aminotransferase [Treponema sp.]|nr:DegT/DnrJ/EryC1/StrS family aminotransferase [Treponema sp.]